MPAGFDLITTFDVIHDLPHPVEALGSDPHRARRRRHLPDGGTGRRASLVDNFNPRGVLIIGFSLLYCLPQSLVDGGLGLGAAWGPVRAEQSVPSGRIHPVRAAADRKPVQQLLPGRGMTGDQRHGLSHREPALRSVLGRRAGPPGRGSHRAAHSRSGRLAGIRAACSKRAPSNRFWPPATESGRRSARR